MADHASTFLLVTILVLITVVLLFGMKFFSASRQAMFRAAGDDSVRQLAEKSALAQAAKRRVTGRGSERRRRSEDETGGDRKTAARSRMSARERTTMSRWRSQSFAACAGPRGWRGRR
jgi:hypothetical protein